MMVDDEKSYDRVPYPFLSHYNTHPDNLATLAILSGLKVVPVDHCRVLEIGCASGGNLIPMAYGLPASQFIGIDISGVQITEGQQKIKALGLENIRLEKKNILDITPEFGSFDYIIAHGIYSWVPLEVQEKLLEVCRQNLAPNGVAFVSYNTYPGWYMIKIARDIMLYHTRGIENPQERAAQGRAVLRFFAEAHKDPADGYFSFLQLYADYLEGKTDNKSPKDDSALLHDELEEINQPVYFHQFVEHAEAHDLQYLADLRQFKVDDIKPEAVEVIRKNSNSLIEVEQSMDFLQDRTFRQTLLCHKNVVINRQVTPQMLEQFYLSSKARPTSKEVDIHQVSVEEFKATTGAVLKMDHPLSKAAMLCLVDAYPESIAFPDLVAAAWRRLGDGEATEKGAAQETKQDLQVLAANVLKAFSYSTSLMELHSYKSFITSRIDDKPIASWLVRFQSQIPGSLITNLRHERVTLEEFDRFLLPYLDGKHDREALLSILMDGPVARGVLKLEREGAPVTKEEQRPLLATELDIRLKWLAQASLFEDPGRLGEEGHGLRKSH